MRRITFWRGQCRFQFQLMITVWQVQNPINSEIIMVNILVYSFYFPYIVIYGFCFSPKWDHMTHNCYFLFFLLMNIFLCQTQSSTILKCSQGKLALFRDRGRETSLYTLSHFLTRWIITYSKIKGKQMPVGME